MTYKSHDAEILNKENENFVKYCLLESSLTASHID